MSKEQYFLPSEPELRLIELLESNPELRRHAWVARIHATHFSTPTLFAKFQAACNPSAGPVTTEPPVPPRQRNAHRREFTRLAKLLQSFATRRGAAAIFEQAGGRLRMLNADHRAVLTDAIAGLRSLLGQERSTEPGLRPSEAACAMLDHMIQTIKRPAQPPSPSTPFPSLNQCIGRLLPGRVYLLVGPPLVGKSAMAVQMAAHIARECKQPTALFSSHLNLDRLMRGFVVASAECDLPGAYRGCFTDQMIDDVSAACRNAVNGPVGFLSGPATTFTDLEVFLEGFREGAHPTVLIVDGLTSSMLGGDFGTAGLNRALARFREVALDRQVAVIVFAGCRAGDCAQPWKSATPQHPNRLELDSPAAPYVDLVGYIWDMEPREEWRATDAEGRVTGLSVLANSFGREILIRLKFDDNHLVFEEI